MSDRDLRVLRYLVEDQHDGEATPAIAGERRDPAAEQRLVDAMARAWASPPPEPALPAPAPQSPARVLPAGVLPIDRGRRSSHARKWLIYPSLMAAMVLVFIALNHPRYDDVPDYRCEARVAGVHLGAAERAHVKAGSTLEVVARPVAAATDPVEIAAWLGGAAGTFELPISFVPSKTGVFRAAIPASQLKVPAPADYWLVLFIGRPGAMPSPDEARRLVADPKAARKGSLAIVREQITVESNQLEGPQ